MVCSHLTTDLRTIFFWHRSTFFLRNFSTLLFWVVSAFFSLYGLEEGSLRYYLIFLELETYGLIYSSFTHKSCNDFNEFKWSFPRSSHGERLDSWFWGPDDTEFLVPDDTPVLVCWNIPALEPKTFVTLFFVFFFILDLTANLTWDVSTGLSRGDLR